VIFEQFEFDGGRPKAAQRTRIGTSAQANDPRRSIIDELLVNGVSQDVIDAVVAVAPQGDATEGLATDSPDATPVNGDPDSQVPQEPA
jgi:hypothetical protein